jgi:hypothetical protein
MLSSAKSMFCENRIDMAMPMDAWYVSARTVRHHVPSSLSPTHAMPQLAVLELRRGQTRRCGNDNPMRCCVLPRRWRTVGSAVTQDDDLRPSKKDFPRPTANKAASRILIGSCQSSNGRETEPAEQSSSAEQVASKM